MLNLFEGSMCLTNICTLDPSSMRMWFRQYLCAVVRCIGSEECITLVRLTDIIMVENSIIGQFLILLNTSPSSDYNFPISPFLFSYPIVLEDTHKVLVQIDYIFSCKNMLLKSFFPFLSGIVLFALRISECTLNPSGRMQLTLTLSLAFLDHPLHVQNFNSSCEPVAEMLVLCRCMQEVMFLVSTF